MSVEVVIAGIVLGVTWVTWLVLDHRRDAYLRKQLETEREETGDEE